jgi:hypothetical protein
VYIVQQTKNVNFSHVMPVKQDSQEKNKNVSIDDLALVERCTKKLCREAAG